MEDEYMARSEEAEVQNDGGSNNGNGSTASHSSEEFVKVNDEDATLDEGAGDIPREDIEELPVHTETPAEGRLIDKIDPREPQPQDCEKSEVDMSSEQEHQQEPAVTEIEGGEPDEPKFQQEAEPQMMVQPEVKSEEYEEDIQQDVHEPVPSADIKDEKVPDIPAPAVEEIEPKKEPSVPLMSHVPASVVDLIYWRDVKKTAFVFTFLLLILVSLVCYSVISVAAYAGLALLTVTVAFRLYKIVLQTLNGTQQPHPFQDLLDMDVTLSQDRIQKYTNSALCHINCCLTGARNLFLVQNTISSLKLGVFLWLLTYLGACFNGLTLLIIDVILVFTVPIFYEKYQTPIDNYLGIAKSKITELTATVKAKLPRAKKAQKEKAQ
uniref:reticulon-1-A-like isoform X4 n=1 Tax=Styela clava TaxID=7725 RepID=UPI0019396384|nr:reticulon-1-A-like isoform X4 [Styela clava]